MKELKFKTITGRKEKAPNNSDLAWNLPSGVKQKGLTTVSHPEVIRLWIIGYQLMKDATLLEAFVPLTQVDGRMDGWMESKIPDYKAIKIRARK